MMATINSTARTAQYAAQRPSRRLPFSMSTPMCMGMAATTASIVILETGVKTSVFLFVTVLCLCSLLLLLGLVVLISLLLTGLTGLIRLESLVGRITELATNAP